MFPTVSVVVASWERPGWLLRCVRSLRQQDYPRFEIVLVADPAGLAGVPDEAGPPGLVRVENPGGGIGTARNAGIAAAAGEVIAFIDDDAVAEPLWLWHLGGAFSDAEVGAATGTVLGRNGISVQWGARAIDLAGNLHTLDLEGYGPAVPAPAPGTAVMLEGTNMAIRRDVLRRLGGFDSAFRFLFDDADVALRLLDDGLRTAVVPLAQVHHAFAGSARRRSDRTPTDLFETGRSLAIFLRKHDSTAPPEPRLIARRADERRRLVDCMVAGRLMPGDVGRLLETYDAGVCAGLTAVPGKTADFAPHAPERDILPATPPTRPVFSGGWREGRSLRRIAADAARHGAAPTIFVFSPTTLFHRVRYRTDGYWEHTGGRFGRSVRTEPLFQPEGPPGRTAREVARVAKVRGIGDNA